MEMCSTELGKLMEALAKAQAVMEEAKKDSSNPFFKSNYADLSSVWRACRKPLSENGLAIVQTVDLIGERQCLVTVLGHSSGQWIRSIMALPLVKLDAQSIGSALSYCRRYALAAIVGVSPSDDDAEAAMQDLRKPKPNLITDEQIDQIDYMLEGRKDLRKKLMDWAKVERVEDIEQQKFPGVIKALEMHLKKEGAA